MIKLKEPTGLYIIGTFFTIIAIFFFLHIIPGISNGSILSFINTSLDYLFALSLFFVQFIVHPIVASAVAAHNANVPSMVNTENMIFDIFQIIITIVSLLAAYMLLKIKKVGWYISIILMCLFALRLILYLSAGFDWTVIPPLILYFIFLYYLLTKNVRTLFFTNAS